jgi:endoplasmic reticulum chaperone BiP
MDFLLQKRLRFARQKKSRRRRNGAAWILLIVLGMLAAIFLSLPTVQAFATEQGKTTASDDISPVIGIDLGTTYSCVAIFRSGRVEVIPNDQGNRITPSFVAFLSGADDENATHARLIGDAAKNQATMNPENTIFDVKRLIGRSFSDATVQADRKLVPYNIVSSGVNDKPRIKVGTTLFAPEEISAMILSKMKQTAEIYLGQEVNRAVITVPAYFSEEQLSNPGRWHYCRFQGRAYHQRANSCFPGLRH